MSHLKSSLYSVCFIVLLLIVFLHENKLRYINKKGFYSSRSLRRDKTLVWGVLTNLGMDVPGNKPCAFRATHGLFQSALSAEGTYAISTGPNEGRNSHTRVVGTLGVAYISSDILRATKGNGNASNKGYLLCVRHVQGLYIHCLPS